jgi:hypothetical protein
MHLGGFFVSVLAACFDGVVGLLPFFGIIQITVLRS